MTSVRWLPASAAASVAPIWQALEAHAGGGGLANSWEWTDTWLRHFGSRVPHRFALGERDGEPCGIVLVSEGVTRRYGPLTVRHLHLGTAGEASGESVCVEYNRLLVLPEARVEFAAALLAALRREPGWDELTLDLFAPEDAEPLLRASPGMLVRRFPCPAVDLCQVRDSGGDVLSALSASIRARVRRGLRGFGEVRLEWAETAEHALGILDELIALHQRRWTAAGERGAFASPSFTAFHRELIARWIPRGRVLLFRVRSDQGTIGCLYGLIEEGRVYFYQGGFAEFDDNRLRPGLVAHALCMQACLERGLAEYNFLKGESRYKRELSTVERELISATLQRPRPKMLVLEGLRSVRARLRTGGLLPSPS